MAKMNIKEVTDTLLRSRSHHSPRSEVLIDIDGESYQIDSIRIGVEQPDSIVPLVIVSSKCKAILGNSSDSDGR